MTNTMELEDIKTAIIEDMLKSVETLTDMVTAKIDEGDIGSAERLRLKANAVDAIFVRHVARIKFAKDEDALLDLAAFIMAEGKVIGTDRSGTALAVNYITRLL